MALYRSVSKLYNCDQDFYCTTMIGLYAVVTLTSTPTYSFDNMFLEAYLFIFNSYELV